MFFSSTDPFNDITEMPFMTMNDIMQKKRTLYVRSKKIIPIFNNEILNDLVNVRIFTSHWFKCERTISKFKQLLLKEFYE